MWIEAPTVTLIGRPEFVAPTHVPVNWMGEASDGELLAEFGGRACYQSWENPANRTTEAYLANIAKQAHFSVYEHANYSLYLEGVSRSLTHELIRHRHLSPSQLSQRYVDESDCAFVVPPAVLAAPLSVRLEWEAGMRDCLERYVSLVEVISATLPPELSRVESRKAARESARSVLPNATETKLVMTGNARAWRHFIELRGAKGADPEIRRLAVAVLERLQLEAPFLFAGYEVRDGVIYGTR